MLIVGFVGTASSVWYWQIIAGLFGGISFLMMLNNPTRERKANFAKMWFLGQILGCAAYLLICIIFIFTYSGYYGTYFYGVYYSVVGAFFLCLFVALIPMSINTYFYFCLDSFAKTDGALGAEMFQGAVSGATNAYYAQQPGVAVVQNQGPVMYAQPGVQGAAYVQPGQATQPVQYAQQPGAQIPQQTIMVAQPGQVQQPVMYAQQPGMQIQQPMAQPMAPQVAVVVPEQQPLIDAPPPAE